MKRLIRCGSILVSVSISFGKLFAGQGDDNPTGVTGIYNGAVTTGGFYDPNSGNARRTIDDIVVPGSVGAYPLKWSRHFNSRMSVNNNTPTAGQWRFSYIGYAKYGLVENVLTPDAQIFLAEGENFGVEEAIENPDAEGKVSLRMADGGRVVFPAAGQGFVQPIKIVDPYGLETTIVTTGSGANKTTKITEPGGRYLLVHYNGNGYVTNVSAYDGIAGHAAIQTVRYTWVEKTYQHPAAAEVSSLDDDTDDGGASSSTKRTPRN